MSILTRDFGELEVRENEIIEFTQPPFGFEGCKNFAILRDEDIGSQFAWLQSVETQDVCFILFDPSGLSSFYQPNPAPEAVKSLGEGELICWVIGNIPADFKKSTVNLKSPIIINPTTQKGAQIILEQDYPVRYLLMQED